MQIMAHLLKDLLLIAIYNIRHVFCNNSMPIKAYKILTREVTVLDSRNNRARGRLTRRCNIPEEGSFCKLKYRANITQDLSFFISFPISMAKPSNCTCIFMAARRLKTSQGVLIISEHAGLT